MLTDASIPVSRLEDIQWAELLLTRKNIAPHGSEKNTKGMFAG
jgi:hypothetical protein